MPNQIPSLDFNDTFLSIEHLKSCFPNHTVKVTEEDPARQVPPFRIRFPAQNAKGKKRKANEEEKPDEEDLTLVVEPHVIPNRGPYPYNQPKRNTIQFTSTQIEAIRAGMQPGLTMRSCVCDVWFYQCLCGFSSEAIVNASSLLQEFRAFELLRSGLDRSKYLLVKEAKIIAMTCTHAALKRHDLVELGFKYDNILMEEAAQILEIETFIPLLLQNPEDGYSRLKRWIMIGDHHQLPPVIKNMAFQKYSNMEQSLFTRFVRLGVPTVDLDAQGRARARSVERCF
ncbi:intron-binding protein aquarius-like [Sinocyclocheilus grahami]|uniref:intron-binding protein aquarius-like n=1 Tax=Sinocyclocheilus grahami TaxID=75366 RepID=UPI0007AD01EC|nr:PREDICTED: intron-binding protein aquarius-like [Sinocyclocheilus grahami]